MCELSTSGTCQTPMCGEGGAHVCLPGWKFNHDLSQQLGGGSAPDGDEDAILGMILLVQATKDQNPRPAWWGRMAKWAYMSCIAFIQFETAPHPTLTGTNGERLRALKLGSCWGGWDCSNPSCAPPPPHYTTLHHHYTITTPDTWSCSSARS